MAVKELEKASISEAKDKALKLAIEKIEKDFGKEKWGKAMIYNNFAIW